MIMTMSTDIEELFQRIELSDYNLQDITPEELLILLKSQVDKLLELSEIGDDHLNTQISQIIPTNKYDSSDVVPSGSGVDDPEMESKLRPNNKIQFNFQLELQQVESHKMTLLKRFYLKQTPSLSTSQYLDRIFKHCSMSTSVILLCCVYLFNLSLGIYYDNQQRSLRFNGLKIMPLNTLNYYRIILTTIRVALKFLEDNNYKIKHYCKIVGLNVREYAGLELNFLLLIDFKIIINEFILKDTLKFMQKFNQFSNR